MVRLLPRQHHHLLPAGAAPLSLNHRNRHIALQALATLRLLTLPVRLTPPLSLRHYQRVLAAQVVARSQR